MKKIYFMKGGTQGLPRHKLEVSDNEKFVYIFTVLAISSGNLTL